MRFARPTLVVVLALPAAGEERTRRRDRKPPRIKHAQMVDADGNMFADKVVLTYNERVRHKRDADGRYPFAVDGYDIASVGRAKGRKVTIKLDEAMLPDGLAIPSVKYRRVKKEGVRDRARHQARKQTFTKTRPFADAVVVTVNREGDGTVASLPLPFINCGDECTAAFPKGLPITLNASDPAVDWGGDCSGATGPICQLTLDSDKSVSATFGGGDGEGTFTLTLMKAGTGDAQIVSLPPGIDCGTTCTAEFTANSPVVLNANTLPGTVTWAGCVTPGPLSCALVMDLDKTVTATFSGP
jgi:hypothetical protein